MHTSEKGEKVFIGGNYYNVAVLREIKKYIKEAGCDPRLAIDEYPGLPLEDVHDKDIELAKSCPINIYEGTFSAGELMEVERSALDTRTVKKILVVYQRREKALVYPPQMSSMLVSLAKTRPQIITLFGYSNFSVLRSFLKGFLGAPIEYGAGCLLVLGVGTLEKAQQSHSDEGALRNFSRTKVLFTGWGLDRCLKEANRYNVDAIISEACILYVRPVEGWDQFDGTTKGIELYESENIKDIKLLNELILDQIYVVKPEAVLFSQGNKVSVGYYVNPTSNIKVSSPMKDFRKGEGIIAEQFRDCIQQVSDNKISKSEITIINSNSLRLVDNENSRYYIEKANAVFRTFSPYVLKFEAGHVTVDLLDPDFDYEPFQSEGDARGWLDNIVKRAKAKATLDDKYERLCENVWNCITPQDDGAIDVFPQSKEKSWRKALTILEGHSFYTKGETPIFYISRGTENDLPFIIDGYDTGDFYSFGLSEVIKSTNLKEAGVISKEKLADILHIVGGERR